MAGREAIGGVKMPVLLGDGVAERIDAVAGVGNRASFIRAAILEKLGPVSVEPVVDEVLPDVPAKGDAVEASGRWDADDGALLELLGRGPVMPRRAAVELGWQAMRIERSALRLEKAKKITIAGGLMEKVDG